MLLGIDIGGTKVAYTLARTDGEIVARSRRPTPNTGNPERDVDAMLDAVQELLRHNGGMKPDRLGLCVPGPLDLSRGLVVEPPNLSGWHEVPLPAWLEQRLGCPVRMENDANAGALAEWRHGAGQGAVNLAYLTMSTGVGAGLVLDRRIYRGRHGTAGEVGHVAVEWPGERCACGLSGCLEAYVGGRAWSQHLRRHAEDNGLVMARAGARERISPEHLLAAAADRDSWALSQLDRFNRYLGRGIVQLVFTLALDVVVLGTIVAAAGETLCLQPLREYVAEHTWAHQSPGLRIVAAELGDDLPHRSAIAVAQELGRAELS